MLPNRANHQIYKTIFLRLKLDVSFQKYMLKRLELANVREITKLVKFLRISFLTKTTILNGCLLDADSEKY